MGEIMHGGESYSKQMIVDSALSSVSNNPVKNRVLKGIIDNIAPIENSPTASQAYSEGDELIFNNLLYKVTDALGIAQGAELIPSDTGQNIDLVGSVVEQLKALFEDETVLKKIYGSLSYGAITDANFVNSSAGVRYYVTSTLTNSLPSAKSGVLIDITHEANVAMQLFIPWDLSRIHIREKDTADWPTTGNYGWKQIYPDNKKWTTLYSNVNPTTVTLAGLQIDKYYLYEVIVHIGGSDYYTVNVFFNNVKNNIRKRIYTVGGWYADIQFNLWSNTPISVTGYNNSGVEQTGNTVIINAREQ